MLRCFGGDTLHVYMFVNKIINLIIVFKCLTFSSKMDIYPYNLLENMNVICNVCFINFVHQCVV